MFPDPAAPVFVPRAVVIGTDQRALHPTAQRRAMNSGKRFNPYAKPFWPRDSPVFGRFSGLTPVFRPRHPHHHHLNRRTVRLNPAAPVFRPRWLLTDDLRRPASVTEALVLNRIEALLDD